MTEKQLAEVELIKADSRLLRGTIVQGLADPLTGAMPESDTQLLKFHGTYQQDDRDLRSERRRQRLEPAYSFMIRVRVPAGVCSASQWLAMDDIAHRYANGTIRITTRQAFQFHGVVKRKLRETIATINASLLDTLAACGDVNRNVMCATLPARREIHAQASALALGLSKHLSPRTPAYHEIWLDGERLTSAPEEEPIYGRTYLPRKFKIVVAVPPDNDVDVFAHDLGFIAITTGERVTGYTVTVGGGMGMSHGERATYPRLADVLGFVTPEQALRVAEAVVTTQRDFGDRTNRKHARLKYTVEDMGLPAFKAEVEKRAGFKLAPPAEFRFRQNGDTFGWVADDSGRWHYTAFVASGRITDLPGWRGLTGLRAIAQTGLCEFRLTPNQNLVLSGIATEHKTEIEQILVAHGLNDGRVSPTRRLALACVGLPTCGLAMAESERYFPDFLSRMEELLARHGLEDEAITVRITGCPNGCARPFLAEIAVVGKGPDRYNLYLGAAFDGSRLNVAYGDNLAETEILAALDPLFARYAAERSDDERFGDFLVRAGIVPSIYSGVDFASAQTRLGGAGS